MLNPCRVWNVVDSLLLCVAHWNSHREHRPKGDDASTLETAPVDNNREGSPPLHACWVLKGPGGRKYEQVLITAKETEA